LLKDGKIKNTVTNESPLIIHANGGSVVKNTLNDYYEKIFDKRVIKSFTPNNDKIKKYTNESDILIGLFLDEKVSRY